MKQLALPLEFDFEVGDIVVVTGPLGLLVDGEFHIGGVFLNEGEVAEVTEEIDRGNVRVRGRDSDGHQYIASTSLTPFSVVAEDESVQWGDLIDPEYIHDYVYEEDE